MAFGFDTDFDPFSLTQTSKTSGVPQLGVSGLLYVNNKTPSVLDEMDFSSLSDLDLSRASTQAAVKSAEVDVSKLNLAKQQMYAGQVLGVASAGITARNNYNNAKEYYEYVKSLKPIYEIKKKELEINAEYTIDALEEELKENVSQLNVVMASKNVSVESQGVQSLKDRGMGALSRDVGKIDLQTTLQKNAIDLEYNNMLLEAERAKDKAKKSGLTSFLSSAIGLGATILSGGNPLVGSIAQAGSATALDSLI